MIIIKCDNPNCKFTEIIHASINIKEHLKENWFIMNNNYNKHYCGDICYHLTEKGETK